MKTPLRVGLVAGSLNVEHLRGMGRYLLDMSSRTRAGDALSWVLFGDDPRQPMHLPEGVPAKADVFEFKGHRFRLWEQIGVPQRGLRHGVDLLHYAENTMAWWQPVPSVVTVHDTLPWESGQPSFYWDRLLPAALHRCAHVITISENSRLDILKHWPALASKLTVIPHGIADAYFADDHPAGSAALDQALGGRPYLVYLGGPMARKRFDWALDVLAHTPLPGLQLVACGFGESARPEAERQVPEPLRGRVHFAPFISDDELRALYRGARAVLYPTLYEGFGFPAVEAQASGVPALFSALGSLGELVGPLAWVLPPHDRQAWVAKVQEAVALPYAVRAELTQQARHWARRFQWRESYRKHLAVYEQVAQRANIE